MMKMLGALQKSQKKVEEVKEAMANELIAEKSSDELLTVVVSKNGRLKDLQINDDLLEDKEQLSDYLILTLNKALEKAQLEYDKAIENAAKEGMPKIPGMPF